MKIEFTVEEYFEQLKLMEKQYGQEEDLYPWIYMLLQMAECEKQKLKPNEYKQVSIRDVHDMSLKYSSLKGDEYQIRKHITDKESVPDFVVFDTCEE